MGGDIPKQFLPVGGKPVLMRTLERFREYSADLEIILVLPKSQQEYWLQLCKDYHFNITYQLADGGETRFHSVKNGLRLIPDDVEGIVGVHDGVRPFVSIDVIRRCYDTARKEMAVIPVMPVVETLRHINGDGTGKNVLRSDYRLVQTPQTFDIQLLKAANKQDYSEQFTDDASVVEALVNNENENWEYKDVRIKMVEGNRENIKLTTPYDLQIAELLYRQQLND